jgi:hypothetical protein
VFAFGCDVYDVTETVKGLKAGVAVEGNTFLLPSDKPTATQLYLRDGLVIMLAALPAVLCLVLHSQPLFYAALSGPVVAAVKHVLGGRAWAKLIAGAKPTSAEQVQPGSN